eukprot:Polyplicarium_translucidae@DN2943_c0_g1_i2.p1
MQIRHLLRAAIACCASGLVFVFWGSGKLWFHSMSLSSELAIITTVSGSVRRPKYLGAHPVPVQFVRCDKKGKKQLCVLDTVRAMNPDTVVILADADVLYSNWTVKEVVNAFEDFQTEILLSAERFSYPVCDSWTLRPDVTLGQDNFPNSGFIVGKVRHVIQLLEYSQSVFEDGVPDQGFIQKYWLAHLGNSSKVQMDIGRKIVTTLSDWVWWHTTNLSQIPKIDMEQNYPEEKFACPVPWYYLDVCGTTNRWSARSWMRQCVNTSRHGLCTNLQPRCADAYDITGCRVAQRQISRGPVSEEALRRTREGDWAEELWDFLPGRESFAYHGNYKSRTMFKQLLKRLEAKCRPAVYIRALNVFRVPLLK